MKLTLKDVSSPKDEFTPEQKEKILSALGKFTGEFPSISSVN